MSGAAGSSSLSEPSSGQGSPAINNSPLSLQLTNDDEKKRRILEQIDWRNYECKTWHLEPTVRYAIPPCQFLFSARPDRFFFLVSRYCVYQVTLVGWQTN